MLNYLYTEAVKWKRRKLWLIFVLGFIVCVFLHKAALDTMMRDGMRGAVSPQLYYLSIFPVLFLLQLIVAGILGTVVFQQEYQARVFPQMKTFPISPGRYIAAKLLWIMALNFIFSVENILIFAGMCMVYGIPLNMSKFLLVLASSLLGAFITTVCSMLIFNIAVFFQRSGIVPTVCIFISMIPLLAPSMGLLSIPVGSAGDYLMKYVYPPGSGTMLCMRWVYHYFDAEAYGMTLPQIYVSISVIGFVLTGVLLFGLLYFQIREREVAI